VLSFIADLQGGNYICICMHRVKGLAHGFFLLLLKRCCLNHIGCCCCRGKECCSDSKLEGWSKVP